MNYLRTAILLAGLTALFMGIGYLIGGAGGAIVALFIAAGMNLVTYWNADRLVLSMHGAHEVDETTAPDLVRLVRDLARNAGLPMPRVYLMDNPQPNAFATGRNPEHAAVAVTTGLLRMLSREEIAGVLDALASALIKISNAAQQIENPAAERNPATARLFIINPLTHHGIDNLFSTHPSTENRIAALERLAAEMGRGGFNQRASATDHPARSANPWGNAGGRSSPWG